MSQNKRKSFFVTLPFYLLVFTLIAFLSFPTIANCLLMKALGLETVEGLAFLNYRVFFISRNHLQVFGSLVFAWFAALVYFWSKVSGGKKTNKGDEHGTARWLSDDEFDDIIPWYIFRRNEQEYKEEQIKTKFDILETSSVNVFKEMEFTNKFKEENNE